MAYSEGFHPKPLMSLPPALPVGVGSLGECLDLKLTEAPAPEELLVGLNRAAPEGLRFFAASPLLAMDAGLSSLVDGAEYVLGLGRAEVDQLGGSEVLADLVSRFLRRTSAVVARTSQGRTKSVDVRAFVRELGLGGEAALVRAGAKAPFCALTVRVSIPGSGAVRAAEVLEAVVGTPGTPHAAVRTVLLCGDHPAWDIPTLRARLPRRRDPLADPENTGVT